MQHQQLRYCHLWLCATWSMTILSFLAVDCQWFVRRFIEISTNFLSVGPIKSYRDHGLPNSNLAPLSQFVRVKRKMSPSSVTTSTASRIPHVGHLLCHFNSSTSLLTAGAFGPQNSHQKKQRSRKTEQSFHIGTILLAVRCTVTFESKPIPRGEHVQLLRLPF